MYIGGCHNGMVYMLLQHPLCNVWLTTSLFELQGTTNSFTMCSSLSAFMLGLDKDAWMKIRLLA